MARVNVLTDDGKLVRTIHVSDHVLESTREVSWFSLAGELRKAVLSATRREAALLRGNA